MAETLPVPPPAPPRKRRPRLLFTILVLLVVLVALLPTAAASVARQRLAGELTTRLGTPCHIGSLSAGWLSGFDLRDVTIGNAPGFDASHPFLRIGKARADVSLLRLFSGRFDVIANVERLQLWLDEDATGATNLQRLLALAGIAATTEVEVTGPPRAPRPPREAPQTDPAARPTLAEVLERLRLDLALRDASIEIRRDGTLLEAVHDLDLVVDKQFEVAQLRTTLDATLPDLRGGANPGAVHLDAIVDAARESAKGSLRAVRLDLSRYDALLRAALSPEDLIAFAGKVDGDITFEYDAHQSPRLQTNGELTVVEPHLAGALVGGLNLRAPRWTFKPRLRVDGDGNSSRIVATGTHIDLGFVQIEGTDGDAGGAAAKFSLDLRELSALGGPFATVGDLAGHVSGTLHIDPTLLTAFDRGDAVAALQQLRGLAVDATIADGACAGGGFALAGGTLTATLRDGKLAITSAPGTTLNTGPLEVRCSADAAGAMPFELTLGWRDGKVAGDAAHLLRYAAPVLAGLGNDQGALASTIGLQLSLRGPARQQGGESILQWLDRFTGDGELELKDGSFTPAGALAGLGDLLGQQGRLAIDRLAGGFTMQQGTISSKAMRWISKGKEYGLTGAAHLDGRLEFGLDVTTLLQQHKDGKVIAAFLGDRPLLAGLGGTLDAPTLAPPDFGKLLGDALQAAPRKLLEQQGQDLLKKGLEELLKKKKQ